MGGYFSRSFNPNRDLSDLSRRVIIVTGGNTGIGYSTVQHLARHGAKVYMAARNEEKAKAAINQLHKEGLNPGNGEVIWLKLDLSDPRNAKKAAEDFMAKEKRLDVLVNNAALLVTPYSVTRDGISDIMMVNHVSPFILTMSLLPLMRETAKQSGSDVRIVNVSSELQAKGGIRFRNREDFNDEHASSLFPAASRYARTKLANMLFTNELQRRFDAEGIPIIALSLHPGSVDTGGNQAWIARTPSIVRFIFGTFGRFFFIPPDRGSYASVFAAGAPVVRAEPEKYKAAYLTPKARIGKPPSQQATNANLAKELWETTERIVKEIGV